MVEGILVLHIPEIRELCNMKIFVDANDDVRLGKILLSGCNSFYNPFLYTFKIEYRILTKK